MVITGSAVPKARKLIRTFSSPTSGREDLLVFQAMSHCQRGLFDRFNCIDYSAAYSSILSEGPDSLRYRSTLECARTQTVTDEVLAKQESRSCDSYIEPTVASEMETCQVVLRSALGQVRGPETRCSPSFLERRQGRFN